MPPLTSQRCRARLLPASCTHATKTSARTSFRSFGVTSRLEAGPGPSSWTVASAARRTSDLHSMRCSKDAKRRRFDVLVCWRLDRLGRNLRHLVTMLEDLQHVGVAFVSLGEGIDCTTPAGKLQLHILAALAEFERERIKERVIAGMARAKAQGKHVGRPSNRLTAADLAAVTHLSVREAASHLGVSKSLIADRRRAVIATAAPRSPSM